MLKYHTFTIQEFHKTITISIIIVLSHTLEKVYKILVTGTYPLEYKTNSEYEHLAIFRCRTKIRNKNKSLRRNVLSILSFEQFENLKDRYRIQKKKMQNKRMQIKPT